MRKLVLLSVIVILLISASPTTPQICADGWCLTIVEQPHKCYGCVTSNYGEATLFSYVWRNYGTVGLLAHDYRSGYLFYDLQPGDALTLWRDGVTYRYVVVEAFSWYPPGVPGWQEGNVFAYAYSQGGLTLQTCLGNGFWFVRAVQM